MNKYIEKILSSILLCTSVLLGLSFWLNVRFSFNIFYAEHWDELAKLQVSHTPIDKTFYVSIGVAVFITIFGLYMIFKPRFGKTIVTKTENTSILNTTQLGKQKQTDTTYPGPNNFVHLNQPPKLNLPKNIANIAAQHQAEQSLAQNKPTNTQPTTLHDSELSTIFANAGYKVKPKLTISGFTTNLFAIGNNETVWVGAVDCNIERFKKSIDKLSAIFKETLEDIPITISAFVLDTKQIYISDDNVLIFHNLDELKEFITNNPNPPTDESEQENFDAYSDYIDTIITYAKNI